MESALLSSSEILDMDATALLEAYASGRITPSRAVEAFLAHQERVNPDLNLVVESRAEAARQEASRKDAELAEGAMHGRLFGVPMSIKEALNVAGMRTTGGLRHRRDHVAREDAFAVARLRDEGAIVLDKTNTPTLCFCQETNNLLYGRSNNPWNPECTTGGSSGGEAALLAVGGAAAGLGSDIGGSIRIPAHFNGVVGFKPGAGAFPLEGHYPDVTEPDQKPMLGFGPIVKSVRDAALIYSVLHPAFDPPDLGSLPDGLTVIGFGSFHKTRCTPETETILARAQDSLAGAGARIEHTVPEWMRDVPEAWLAAMAVEKGAGIAREAYPGRPWGFVGDLLKSWTGLKPQNHFYLSWALLGCRLFPPNENKKRWMREFASQNLDEFNQMVGNSGVFLIPAYPSPALPHGKVYWQLFHPAKTMRWYLPFTVLANILGLPAMIVPCGFSNDGMPIGLQLVGPRGGESRVFQVAAFLEREMGGYKRCTRWD